jgi:hypothetical protein
MEEANSDSYPYWDYEGAVKEGEERRKGRPSSPSFSTQLSVQTNRHKIGLLHKWPIVILLKK